jgi:hypothetical protein
MPTSCHHRSNSEDFILHISLEEPLKMRRELVNPSFRILHLTPVGGFPPGTPVSTNFEYKLLKLTK